MGGPWPLIPGNNLDDLENVGQSLQNIGLGHINNNALGSAFTLNFAAAHTHIGELTADVTLSFTAPTRPGILQVFLTDTAGGHAITLPGNGIWMQGIKPAPLAAGKTRVLDIRYEGANYYVWYSPTESDGYKEIATSAGTTQLTASDPAFVLLTGSTTHNLYMPDTTAPLFKGYATTIVNTSTGNVTVRASDGTLIMVLLAGLSVTLYCKDTASSTTASWVKLYQLGSFSPTWLNTANSTVIRDSSGNTAANDFFSRLESIATAGGTTTLTVANAFRIRFTGSLNQTVVMPVATTFSQAGFARQIINDSTGILTIQSSGGNQIVVIPPGCRAWIIATATSGTDASSWTIAYDGPGPQINTITSASTITPDLNYQETHVTALAATATLAAFTGPKASSMPHVIRIKDNGTPRTLNYDASYRAIGCVLPTITQANKTLYLGTKWNATDSKVDVLAVVQE